MVFKIQSWNVNGLRAVARKGFADILKRESPDVLCVQETKLQDHQLTDSMRTIDSYKSFFSFAKKKGYSGVGIYTKQEPLAVLNGVGDDDFDDEGRVVTVELEQFFVCSVYVPNSQHGLKRLDFRKRFNEVFKSFLKDLEKSKPVIVCGDFNVAHNEIDITNPKANQMNPGFYIEEREHFSDLLDKGFIDTFRYFYPDTVRYSWWSYRFNARARNIGWRLDYILVPKNLLSSVQDALIRNDIYGSDHCPVELHLGDIQ
ncbi:MAG: exodeoxyribonuclease III [Nanobdellota archaeon]